MSGSLWIFSGLIAGLFAAFAVPYGFERAGAEKADGIAKMNAGSFSLLDATYDLKLTGVTEKSEPNNDKGRLLAIVDVADRTDVDNSNARFHLGGFWYGSDGIILVPQPDTVIFIRSEGTIQTIQKKPFIDQIRPGISKIYNTRKYLFRIFATPTIGLPLKPEFLIIRTREGINHVVTSFHPVAQPGWYEAEFSF
ncbi:MAG: hypothetical protein EOP05_01700 [Proteobacteria bacterium]|nr:MAG: hypothetical protein EOP05_01700 [Pseudomonadota bacterium]